MTKPSPRLVRSVSTIAVCALLAAHSASAATITWNVATGDFMVGTNWTPGFPGVTDDAAITNGGTATMSAGDVTLDELWVGNTTGAQNGTLIQTGGSFTLTNGLSVGRQTGAVGLYEMTGGTLTTVNFRVGGGPPGSSQGTMTVSGSDTGITSTGAGVTGVGVAGTGALTLQNSAVFTHDSTTSFLVGSDNAVAGANGGIGTLNVNSGAQLNIATGNLAIGRNTNGNGTVNVNGGSITLAGAGGAINLAGINGASTGGTGVLTLTTGSVTASVVRIWEGSGTVNLNGGTLTTGSLIKNGTNVSAAVNFNGGTVQASAASSDFLNGFTSSDLDILAGGLVFDTNSNDITITQGLDGVGGLTKQGAGTLALTGVGAYGGDTVIEGGTLSINTIFLADGSNVEISGSGVFNLDFAGTDTINMLSFNDVAQGGGTWGSLTSLADNKRAFFTGDGILFVAVPEPAQVSLIVAAGLGLLAVARRRRVAQK